MKTIALASSVALAVLFTPVLAFADDQSGVVIEQVPTNPPTTQKPAEAEPPPPAPAVQPKKSIPVGIRIDGGYALRSLEKLPTNGADLGLALGAQPMRHFAVYGAARLFIGSTEGGLDVKAFRFSVDMDIVIDRFRIGFEPGIFIAAVDRATKDQTIVAWGPKLGLNARFDVVRSEPFALFLRAAIEGGPTFSDGSFFGGATFGLGVDFDLKRGDRSTL